MANFRFLVAIVALMLLLSLVLASYCPAGYYETTNIEHPCHTCYAGDYCPGDDRFYECPPGTAAPEEGQTKCDACESGRANLARNVCLLPNTPNQAKESPKGVFEVDTKNPYWYQTLYILDTRVIQITFVEKNRKDISLAVFASTSTGKPSKDNYEFMGIGQNVTIGIPKEKFPKSGALVLYLNIIPVDVSRATIEGEQTRALSVIYNLNETDTYIPNAGSDLALYWGVEALFVSHQIPAHSRVQFSISVECLAFHDAVHYKLYYSDLKAIEYPNEYNSQVVATSDGGVVGKASFTVENKERGPIRVALFTKGTIWSARIRVRLDITPL